MKLRVLDKDEVKEKEVFSELVDTFNDSVRVMTKDAKGKSYALLEISEHGVLFYSDVSSEFGFDLDDRGRLKVLNEGGS